MYKSGLQSCTSAETVKIIIFWFIFFLKFNLLNQNYSNLLEKIKNTKCTLIYTKLRDKSQYH